MFALIIAVPVVAQCDTISLNDSWQFHRFSEVEELPTSFAGLKFEETICLPHDFQISQPWIAPSPEEKGDATNQRYLSTDDNTPCCLAKQACVA